MMKVSIVTVCLNAEQTIRETIESVINQTNEPFEYLIMDGQSKDQTLRIAEEYALNHSWMRVYSEKDQGLYDAMNKGVLKSRGDYVLFLNSGDVFYDKMVLEHFQKIVEQMEILPDIFYGDVMRKFGENKIEERYGDRINIFKLFLIGKMPCHQAIFTKRGLLISYPFNLSYHITADYNFLLKCFHNKATMMPLKYLVAVSEVEQGISSQEQNKNQMREEDDRSLKTFYPLWYYILKPVKFLWRRRGDSCE